MAVQLEELPGLTRGQKLKVMDAYDACKAKEKSGRRYARNGAVQDVCKGICGAMVPILIPFSQTYKDTIVEGPGGAELDVGTIISIVAICFSVLGTLVMAYQEKAQTKKFAEMDLLEFQQSESMVQNFLSMTTNYNDPTDGNIQDESVAVKEAFKLFVWNYQYMKEQQAEMRKGLARGAQPKGDPPAAAGGETPADETPTAAVDEGAEE